MTIKTRIQKLEQRTARPQAAGDTWRLRKVDYRAGIVDGIDADPDAIPVRWVDYMQSDNKADVNNEHSEPTKTT